MSDRISKELRSENMRRIRSKNMKPEMIVRRLVHGMGYRYRLHRRDLPGKPDLVFSSRRKVIFVHGCFWHQHSDPACLDGRMPKSNKQYWSKKLNRNKKRDKETEERLIAEGWEKLIIWECAVKDTRTLENVISEFLEK